MGTRFHRKRSCMRLRCKPLTSGGPKLYRAYVRQMLSGDMGNKHVTLFNIMKEQTVRVVAYFRGFQL